MQQSSVDAPKAATSRVIRIKLSDLAANQNLNDMHINIEGVLYEVHITESDNAYKVACEFIEKNKVAKKYLEPVAKQIQDRLL